MNQPAEHRVFVYGTLKAGFPNAHVMRGRRVPGRFVTARKFALYVVDKGCHVPWLVDAPGPDDGEHVEGELYGVDRADMPALDRLESIGEPGGYARVEIDVVSIDDHGRLGVTHRAEAYLQNLAHLNGRAIQDGPLRVYTLAHAARYKND